MNTVTSADDVASHVLRKAMDASKQGTFAVGGILFQNDTGEVIKEMHNNVLVPLNKNTMFTQDPTAHGERQLVSWYFENKTSLNLPDPEKLTLVTSLDPCAMCTGALLTAGFNVGVIALDDYAGINYNSKFDFPDLPEPLRVLAQKKFGYYACGIPNHDPPKNVREYIGSNNLPFRQDAISVDNLKNCRETFDGSQEHIRKISNQGSGNTPDKMTDPVTLPDDSVIKINFRKIYKNAFTVKTKNSRSPDINIIDELKSIATNSNGDGNAVAFIDPFGNLILCLSGAESISPVRTAFMEVVQNYSMIRWNLMKDNSSKTTAEKTLTHPKYGTLVFLYAPNPHDSTTIMTLGAYGSTIEGSIPQMVPSNLQYVYPPRKGTMNDLHSVISKLPPFYTNLVKLSISQTPHLNSTEN